MRPEQAFWSKLKGHMSNSGWDATRHEDSATPGTPDVSWGARGVNGWLELKVVPNLPKHDTDVVKIDLRPKQRVFLLKRVRTGGHCGVLIQVSTTLESVLFTSEKTFMDMGRTLTKQRFNEECAMQVMGLPEPTRLLDIMTGIYRYGEL